MWQRVTKHEAADAVSPAPATSQGPTDASMSRRPFGRTLAGRSLKAVGWCVLAFGACVVVSLVAAAALHNAQQIRDVLLGVLHVTRFFPLLYLGLTAGLWWHWDGAVDWAIRRGYVPMTARELLQSRRNRCSLGLGLLALLMACASFR